MVAHGYNHVWLGGKIAGTGRWFESLGIKPGLLHAWLAQIGLPGSVRLQIDIDPYSFL